MKKHLLTIILFLFLIACQRYNIPDKIENFKTERHILIPGTRLYLITSNKIDLQNNSIELLINSKAKLGIQDFINENYFIRSAKIRQDSIEKDKGKVILFKKFFIDSYNAKLLIAEKDYSKERSFTLIFGDTKFCTTLYCTYPADNKELENEIIKTALSVVYDENIKVDHFQYAKFIVNIDNTDFKYDKGTLDKYFYTTINNSGFDPEAPFFMIRQISGIHSDYISLKAINDKSIEFEKNTYKLMSIDNMKFDTLNLNGLNAIEMYGYANIENKNVLLYNFVIGKNENAIVLNAFIPKEHMKYLKQIRKISNSIKIK